MRDSSLEFHIFFIRYKNEDKLQPRSPSKQLLKYHKYSKLQSKSTTIYPHHKKMEHLSFDCFKKKSKAFVNIATTSNESKKQKNT